MLISRDRTYRTVEYIVHIDPSEDPFEEKEKLKFYVNKLIDKYEFLEGMDCLGHTKTEGSNKITLRFTFWIDEIEILREQKPHLFV